MAIDEKDVVNLNVRMFQRGIFGVCVRHGHILKNATEMDATAEPKEKACAKTTELVVSAWLMVVRWQSSKD